MIVSCAVECMKVWWVDSSTNAMTFDGPGQNAALIRQHLTFRPDWEKVVTPVVDFLLTRPEQPDVIQHWLSEIKDSSFIEYHIGQ